MYRDGGSRCGWVCAYVQHKVQLCLRACVTLTDPTVYASPVMSCAGLYRFEKRFPERIFDVGIAEQHAVTFAAGMACEGMIPMAAIYSSFLQRGYDQVVHDVALQNLPGGFEQ